jgi:hypothetical protein
MKGTLPEDIIWTLIVLVLVVIIGIMGLFALIRAFAFSGEAGLTSTIEYVVASNKPYMLATALTYFKPDDRNFLEHAVEISYSSVDNANSKNLPNYATEFLDKYDTNFYSVQIFKDSKSLLDIFPTKAGSSGVGAKCGDKLEGFCVQKGDVTHQYTTGACGVGRIEIPEGKNECKEGLFAPAAVCCKLDIIEYQKQNPAIEVRTCGRNGDGICSGLEVIASSESPLIREYCAEGFEDKSGSLECSSYNNGKTPTCCIYGDAATKRRQEIRTLKSAEIPLLYKDSFGYAEVTIG